MVGRLVEQQDIGLGASTRAKRGAAGLPAREARRILVAGEAEMLEQNSERGADRCRLRARPRHSRAPFIAAEIRLLRQVAHGGAGLENRRPPSASISPAAIFKSVDLPEPLRPTSAIFSPGVTEFGAIEQQSRAQRQANILEGESGQKPFSRGNPADRATSSGTQGGAVRAPCALMPSPSTRKSGVAGEDEAILDDGEQIVGLHMRGDAAGSA